MVRKRKNYQLNKKGFTLLEVMVVFSILFLLSSLIMNSVRESRVKARDAQRVANVQKVQVALAMFYDQRGYYPVLENSKNCLNDGWQVLQIALVGAGYLKDFPSDERYFYCSSSQTNFQEYILGAALETKSNFLVKDFDGQFSSAIDNQDFTCGDESNLYCLAKCVDGKKTACDRTLSDSFSNRGVNKKY